MQIQLSQVIFYMNSLIYIRQQIVDNAGKAWLTTG